jgi:hypothetical protein
MFDLDAIFSRCLHTEDDLDDYQRYAIQWLYEHPYSALFAGTGLGKTIIVYTLLNRLLDEGYNAKVLVVAPIKVACTVWPLEYRKWRHTAWMNSALIRVEDDHPKLLLEQVRLNEELKPKLAHLTDRQAAARMKASLIGQHLTMVKDCLRRKLLKHRSQIHIINHEATDWLVNHYVTRRKPWPYRILIWDESTRLRDHNSNVFTAIKEMRPYMDRVHELTATPAKQTYIYFFSQIYLLDQGQRFGRGITAFRQRYFSQNIYSKKWELRPGGAEEMEKKISDIVLPLRKRDFVDTPEPTIRIRTVHLPNLKQYKEFEQTSILEASNSEIIEAKSAGILNGKLLQLASGAVYDNKRGVHFFHEAKFEELEQLLDETQDEPVLCSYWFKPTLARLKKRFPKAAVMDPRGRMIELWNRRKFKLMFIHPASASHGIELQFGGHHLAVLDLFHSAELFEQLIGRLDRRGQEEDVIVHLLAASGTVDNITAKKLQNLEDAQNAMYRRLQRLHRRIRGKV